MKGDSQKIQWLSPKKLAFIWEEKIGEHFPWGYAEIGKKQIIVIAEEGEDLFFVESGENGGYHKDRLCWFCQNSIDLGKLGHAPTCLLGKYILDVTICKNFAPGPCFGEEKEKDMGKRRRMAEKVFSSIQWQNCWDCRFFNTENAYKIVGSEEDGQIFEKPSARFCQILHALPKFSAGRTCTNFKVSEDPDNKSAFERRIKMFHDYIESLTTLEKSKERS